MRTRNHSPFDAVIGRLVAPSCVEATRPERTPADERATLFDAAAVNPHKPGRIRSPVFLAFKEPAVW
jgi:hypothetical protein